MAPPTSVVSWVVYLAIQKFIGLRVSPLDEMNGIELESGEEMAPRARAVAPARAE
ncbi:MAG: hypothetical protein AAFP84_18040 [Actinomycetota bacterium]